MIKLKAQVWDVVKTCLVETEVQVKESDLLAAGYAAIEKTEGGQTYKELFEHMLDVAKSAGFDSLAEAIVKASPQWKPIESAPKDGTHIMLYRPRIQFVGFYGLPISKWCINSKSLPLMRPEPTHWQPLPEPPKQ